MVVSRILKGNIPVQNGIVHLIDKPLMVVARSLYDYVMQEGSEKSNRLYQFAQLIKDKGGAFAETLLESKVVEGLQILSYSPPIRTAPFWPRPTKRSGSLTVLSWITFWAIRNSGTSYSASTSSGRGLILRTSDFERPEKRWAVTTLI